MIQLAVRSGYYRKIIVLPIKEGELLAWNPIEEEISIHDWYDYAGKLFERREKDREKMKRYREGSKG